MLKKYALASASVIALELLLLLVETYREQQEVSNNRRRKPVIKMYQIGDKPDNLMFFLKMPTRSRKESWRKIGYPISWLGWLRNKNERYHLICENEILLLLITMSSMLKKVALTWQNSAKKEGKDLYKALDPAIKGNIVNGKIYAVL